VLPETGVDPATVKLEITESSTMDDPERVIRVLSELKSLGVQLSIDDFGTGYSSLSYLHRFPLDILKIDHSFVSGLLENAESYEIIATIMALAGGIGMKVVAEGVEVEAQIGILQKLGCDFGQGNLFSKPLPAADVPLFLHRWAQLSNADAARRAALQHADDHAADDRRAKAPALGAIAE
jgi:EAL domain-containing protein (putative c-di-GMP-specific phosphodiesterase class I)